MAKGLGYQLLEYFPLFMANKQLHWLHWVFFRLLMDFRLLMGFCPCSIAQPHGHATG